MKLLIEKQYGDVVPDYLIEFYQKYGTDNSALNNALLANDLNAFEILLSYGADPNQIRSGKAAWQLAIESRDEGYYIALLDQIQNPLEQLYYAVEQGNLRVVQYLMEQVQSEQLDVTQIYQKAFLTGNLELITYLFQQGLDHPGLFLQAVNTKNVEIVQLILSYKTPLPDEIEQAVTIAMQAQLEKMVELLYKAKFGI